MNGIGKTHVGSVRDNNEDCIFVSNSNISGFPNLYIVADGMGGHNAGEVASSQAIENFLYYANHNNFDTTEIMDFLIDGILFANKKVYENSFVDNNLKGMGTTFSACVANENKLYIAHVGDSRIYSIKDNIKQLTNDHSFVAEMVRMGQLTVEDAEEHPNKNMLTRAVGSEPDIKVDGYVHELSDDETILLCSDGLTNMVSEAELLLILNTNIDLEEKCNKLIETANQRGGIDNISVIMFNKER